MSTQPTIQERLAQAAQQKAAADAAKTPTQDNKQTPVQDEVKAQPEAEASKQRVFYGEFPEFISYVDPKGTVVGFYKGYTVTDDPAVAEYILKDIKGVKEVTGQKDLKIPRAPERKRSRNWASQDGASATTISPLELLQRSVGNTTHTPQAGESNSQTAA